MKKLLLFISISCLFLQVSAQWPKFNKAYFDSIFGLHGKIYLKDSTYFVKGSINTILGLTGTKAFKSFSLSNLQTFGLLAKSDTGTSALQAATNRSGFMTQADWKRLNALVLDTDKTLHWSDTVPTTGAGIMSRYDGSLKLNTADTSNLVGDTYLANNYKKTGTDTLYLRNDGDISYSGNYSFLNGLLKSATTSTSVERGGIFQQNTTDALGSKLFLYKSRGTNAAPTTIVNGDTIGKLIFNGYDGTSYYHNASISSLSTGTEVSTNRIAGNLLFHTNTTGGVLTERLRIDNAGNLLAGYSTTVGANYRLQLTGNINSIKQSIHCYSTTAANAGVLEFMKSASNTTGIYTNLVGGDILGKIDFYGITSVGNTKFYGASIYAQAATSSVDSKIIFSTAYTSTPVTRFVITQRGQFSFGNGDNAATITPSYTLSINGLQAATLGMERHSTANTAGNSLTISSGGATTGATDKNSGKFIFSTSIATGNGWGEIEAHTTMGGLGTGTTDRTAAKSMGLRSYQLTDDGTVSLDASVKGIFMFTVGDGEEYAVANITSAGAVTLIFNSTNVANTDSDNNFCIITGSNPVVIKNRLGSTKNFTLMSLNNQ